MATAQLDLIVNQVQQLPINEQWQVIERVAASLERLTAESAKKSLPSTESYFRQLADQWRRETEHTASVKQASLHPAYQRIIGMGPAAVPLLLQELEQAPDHWFWALRAITDEDPAQAEDSLAGAARAWLAWGREKGHR